MKFKAGSEAVLFFVGGNPEVSYTVAAFPVVFLSSLIG
jgi:hypothetical protein